MTVLQRVAICFAAGVIGALAVVVTSHDKDKGDKAVRVFEIRTYYAAESKYADNSQG